MSPHCGAPFTWLTWTYPRFRGQFKNWVYKDSLVDALWSARFRKKNAQNVVCR